MSALSPKGPCMHGCINRVHLASTSSCLLVLSCVIGAKLSTVGWEEWLNTGVRVPSPSLPLHLWDNMNIQQTQLWRFFFFSKMAPLNTGRCQHFGSKDNPVWQIELVLWWWWQVSCHLNSGGLNELSVYLLEESGFLKAVLYWSCGLPQKCTPQHFNCRRGRPCCRQPHPHLSFQTLSISLTTLKTTGHPYSLQITMPGGWFAWTVAYPDFY